MARPKKKITGLGDAIEAVTEATGIKFVVEAISEATGIDCGCDEKKEIFNKWVPFGKRVINCPTDEQIEYLNVVFIDGKIPTTLTFKQRSELIVIYNYVYNTRIENSSCADCWRAYLTELKRLL
jgi:hypothetical protein